MDRGGKWKAKWVKGVGGRFWICNCGYLREAFGISDEAPFGLFILASTLNSFVFSSIHGYRSRYCCVIEEAERLARCQRSDGV